MFVYVAPTHFQYTNFQALAATYTSRTKSCHVKRYVNYSTHTNMLINVYVSVCLSPPLSTYFGIYIYMLTCTYKVFVGDFDALAQTGKRFSNRNETSCLRLVRPEFEPRSLWNPLFSRLNACSQTDWAAEDETTSLNSTAHPYDERAISPLDSTVGWFLHLTLAIYMFVVIDFGALAHLVSSPNEFSWDCKFADGVSILSDL